MRILHLTLYRKWFDEIVSGRKRKEFREWTPYWNKRLLGKTFDEVHFRNGYGKGRPFMRVECVGIKLHMESGKSMFIIDLGNITEIKNYPKPHVKHSKTYSRL